MEKVYLTSTAVSTIAVPRSCDGKLLSEKNIYIECYQYEYRYGVSIPTIHHSINIAMLKNTSLRRHKPQLTANSTKSKHQTTL